MRREPKLWKRNANQTWYVKLDGRQIPLGKDEAEARKEYHRLLSCRVIPDRTADTPVVNILSAFLDHVELMVKNGEAAQRTHEFYREHLKRFAGFCAGMRVSELRVHTVTRFLEQRYAGTSTTYRNCAVRSIKRAFNYAEQQEWIERSPVAKVKAPPAVPRDCCLTPEQVQQVWNALTDSDFSDAIRFLILTGARPFEMRTATAAEVNREAHAITFSRKGSKGKKHHRTITLSDAAWTLVERRLAKSGGSYLFTNEDGHAWTRSGLNCGCRRLSKRLRKLHGEFPRVFCYLMRHTWATDSLCAGQDAETVAKLMGHTAGSPMLSKVYSHVVGRNEYLRSVTNKIDEARRLA